MFGKSFSGPKLSIQSKSASSRMKIQSNKLTNEANILKKEIVENIRSEQYARAFISLESVIHKEYRVEAFDILTLMCDMLTARASFLASEKELPTDMFRPVHTIIWAAKRSSVPEMVKIVELLRSKFGSKLISRAMSDGEGSLVDKTVQARLSMHPPAPAFKARYLVALANDNDIQVDPNHPELSEVRALVLELLAPPGPAGPPPAPYMPHPPGGPGGPGMMPPPGPGGPGMGGGGGGAPYPTPGGGGGLPMPMPMPMPMPGPPGPGPAGAPVAPGAGGGGGGSAGLYPPNPTRPQEPAAAPAPPMGGAAGGAGGAGGGLGLPAPPTDPPSSTAPQGPAPGAAASAPSLDELTLRFGRLRGNEPGM